MKYSGLRAKLIFMVIGVLVLSVCAAAFMIEEFFYQNVINQKKTMAEILTASLVHDIKYDYQAGRKKNVGEIISKYITYYRIIRNISFYNSDLWNTADSDRSKIGHRTQDQNIIAAVSLARPTLEVIESERKSLGIRSISPILQGSRIIGAVVMDLSIEDLELTVSAISHRVITILLVTIGVATSGLFIMFRSIILVRLNRLISITRDIAAGNYDVSVADKNKDEIGQLSMAFDQMTAELRKSKRELNEYHDKHLEEKVKHATAQLQKAYKDLQSAQSQIVLQEKMASLGILIAGIAHEINTPVGAIGNISKSLEQEIVRLPRLLKDLHYYSDVPVDMILDCLNDVVERSGTVNQIPSYKTVRHIKKILEERSVVGWRSVANTLAALNFLDEEKIIRHMACLRKPGLFKLVACVGSIAQAAAIAGSSCNKIQEIVKALKYYAYTDKGKVEMTDINESVNTALILLRNKLKYTINVSTQWDEELPRMPCTSEIHQVWTNLLNNAHDAIEQMGKDYSGEISVSTSKAGEYVVVSITDNGVGIPEDKLNNIFDPFFTTKDMGKGTGLGLSIVSGIVKKHNGNIRVRSRHGHTEFQIALPLSGINSSDNGKRVERPLEKQGQRADRAIVQG